MAHTRREAFEITHRRSRVLDMYLRGRSQSEIAIALSVHQATVSRDLKALEREWATLNQANLTMWRNRELARLDAFERQCWMSWRASIGERRKSRSKTRRDLDGRPVWIETVVTREQSPGDPQYLDGVMWCIEQRCKLLGLYAPTRVEAHVPTRVCIIEQIVEAAPNGNDKRE
jgi:DNA-binding CsgD family transcriptional regulator